ncbi:hypothetical protein [Sinisalibacter lacisalsi]|uniref:Uncharacterized protein n=1 Tax=Sinisalibacter lacisalsi TaxID=1526570 RepID=A0ABQ1QFE6_9RHOB|nr:hypothetical protein [Sinisalibacter lacisalsi]GGD23378.1 hypothetical protein GCM10011358_04830 [Sinisalibacter lacisalsi]
MSESFRGRLKEGFKDLAGLNWVAVGAIVALGTPIIFLLEPSARGTGIGSIAAILIAFVAYPWQKRKDRELQLQSEERAAYKDFFSVAHSHIFAIQTRDFEAARKLINESRVKYNSLTLYASLEVLGPIRDFVDAIQVFEIRTRSDVEKQIPFGEFSPASLEAIEKLRIQDKRALKAARHSISDLDQNDASQAVGLIYRHLTIDLTPHDEDGAQ